MGGNVAKQQSDDFNPMSTETYTIQTDDVRTLDETMQTLAAVNNGRITSTTLWFDDTEHDRTTEYNRGPSQMMGFISAMADRPAAKYTDMVLKVEVEG
jgi:hypothetical protein